MSILFGIKYFIIRYKENMLCVSLRVNYFIFLCKRNLKGYLKELSINFKMCLIVVNYLSYKFIIKMLVYLSIFING